MNEYEIRFVVSHRRLPGICPEITEQLGARSLDDESRLHKARKQILDDFSAFIAFNRCRKKGKVGKLNLIKSGCDDIKIIIFRSSLFYELKEQERESEGKTFLLLL